MVDTKMRLVALDRVIEIVATLRGPDELMPEKMRELDPDTLARAMVEGTQRGIVRVLKAEWPGG